MKKNILSLLLMCAAGYLHPLRAQDAGSTAQPSPTDPVDETTGRPLPTYNQPGISYLSVYRKNIESGIMVADGAEITFPGVNSPDMRTTATDTNHLTLTDTMADGTASTSYWDLSTLVNKYMQSSHPKPGGAHTNAAVTDEDVIYQAFDALKRETFCTYHAQSPADPAYDPATNVQLGSVFVDNTNRVIYTPPHATMFFPAPAGVNEITSVTFLPRNGIIVVEWLKYTETSYHVVGINVSNQQIVFDFMPDSAIDHHHVLSWIDDNTLLGEFTGRNGSSYSVIDINQHTITAKTDVKYAKGVRIKGGTVNVYSAATGTPDNE